MSCLKCEERKQLIQEAFAAYREGDMDSYWSKMQIAAASFGQDVKLFASALWVRENQK